jgi:CheY-like chemotaxis protein
MTQEILIIEDNEDNSILAEKILNYYGFKTVVKIHGQAALEYCKNNFPALILMDLSLPDIDGIELTKLLRQNDSFQSIPIIALTAHAMRETQQSAAKAGLNEFLTKPFLPNDLITLVKKYLKTDPISSPKS